jgi:hypothetical protein
MLLRYWSKTQTFIRAKNYWGNNFIGAISCVLPCREFFREEGLGVDIPLWGAIL